MYDWMLTYLLQQMPQSLLTVIHVQSISMEAVFNNCRLGLREVVEDFYGFRDDSVKDKIFKRKGRF